MYLQDMDGYLKFVDSYYKVNNVIESCNRIEHTQVSQQMIDNLNVFCSCSKIPYDFYVFYINDLKSSLNKKINELSQNIH